MHEHIYIPFVCLNLYKDVYSALPNIYQSGLTPITSSK